MNEFSIDHFIYGKLSPSDENRNLSAAFRIVAMTPTLFEYKDEMTDLAYTFNIDVWDQAVMRDFKGAYGYMPWRDHWALLGYFERSPDIESVYRPQYFIQAHYMIVPPACVRALGDDLLSLFTCFEPIDKRYADVTMSLDPFQISVPTPSKRKIGDGVLDLVPKLFQGSPAIIDGSGKTAWERLQLTGELLACVPPVIRSKLSFLTHMTDKPQEYKILFSDHSPEATPESDAENGFAWKNWLERFGVTGDSGIAFNRLSIPEGCSLYELDDVARLANLLADPGHDRLKQADIAFTKFRHVLVPKQVRKLMLYLSRSPPPSDLYLKGIEILIDLPGGMVLIDSSLFPLEFLLPVLDHLRSLDRGRPIQFLEGLLEQRIHNAIGIGYLRKAFSWLIQQPKDPDAIYSPIIVKIIRQTAKENDMTFFQQMPWWQELAAGSRRLPENKDITGFLERMMPGVLATLDCDDPSRGGITLETLMESFEQIPQPEWFFYASQLVAGSQSVGIFDTVYFSYLRSLLENRAHHAEIVIEVVDLLDILEEKGVTEGLLVKDSPLSMHRALLSRLLVTIEHCHACELPTNARAALKKQHLQILIYHCRYLIGVQIDFEYRDADLHQHAASYSKLWSGDPRSGDLDVLQSKIYDDGRALAFAYLAGEFDYPVDYKRLARFYLGFPDKVSAQNIPVWIVALTFYSRQFSDRLFREFDERKRKALMKAVAQKLFLHTMTVARSYREELSDELSSGSELYIEWVHALFSQLDTLSLEATTIAKERAILIVYFYHTRKEYLPQDIKLWRFKFWEMVPWMYKGLKELNPDALISFCEYIDTWCSGEYLRDTLVDTMAFALEDRNGDLLMTVIFKTLEAGFYMETFSVFWWKCIDPRDLFDNMPSVLKQKISTKAQDVYATLVCIANKQPVTLNILLACRRQCHGDHFLFYTLNYVSEMTPHDIIELTKVIKNFGHLPVQDSGDSKQLLMGETRVLIETANRYYSSHLANHPFETKSQEVLGTFSELIDAVYSKSTVDARQSLYRFVFSISSKLAGKLLEEKIPPERCNRLLSTFFDLDLNLLEGILTLACELSGKFDESEKMALAACLRGTRYPAVSVNIGSALRDGLEFQPYSLGILLEILKSYERNGHTDFDALFQNIIHELPDFLMAYSNEFSMANLQDLSAITKKRKNLRPSWMKVFEDLAIVSIGDYYRMESVKRVGKRLTKNGLKEEAKALKGV
ncbi:MAG: hypothetical protein QNK37_15910 [Acidobacteriota bacterium]|nr:hypothetical protein [Acidobacteriota bacterium]